MPDRTALPRAMLAAWVLLLLAACSQGPAPTPPASWGWQDASGERAIAPDEAYPELFQAVQESRLFSDQKHFVDAPRCASLHGSAPTTCARGSGPASTCAPSSAATSRSPAASRPPRRKRVPISPATSATCGRR